ncbi:tetratricopeptide repeat protein [Gillisia sp. M10.2A]|uniref:Tetratricopeptide repeat protein n=1 Tax=Gillisia lutea TaxID=2909668 RepID=A0ABS9EFS5_9FLAO|nr:tetratricopeptide repeat protein [Gillisia lutea]MCF4100709.1 tetratricopeptide repeat protein [Gillisia lutea]
MKHLFCIKNKKLKVFLGLFLLCLSFSYAQTLQEKDKKIQKETTELLRNAETALGEDNFPAAEAAYRKAVAKDPENTTARYNMGNMYYGKERVPQSTSRYKQAAEVSTSKVEKHKAFHNMGNSYMEQKKYAEAVEAYKNALRNAPSDEETRYNLALAKKMLEKEKQDQDGGGDDNKDQDQKKDDKDKDKKGDEGDKEQDKKDGDKKEDQGGDDKKDEQKQPEKPDDKGDPKDEKDGKEGDKPKDQDQKQPQQQQPQQGQLSPQQIKSLLDAMNNEEKKVQDKINAQKAKGAKTRTDKDW